MSLNEMTWRRRSCESLGTAAAKKEEEEITWNYQIVVYLKGPIMM